MCCYSCSTNWGLLYTQSDMGKFAYRIMNFPTPVISPQLPLQIADKIACNVLSNQIGRQADCSYHADLVLQMLRIRNYFNPPHLCKRNKQFALHLLVIHRCYEGRNYVLQVESFFKKIAMFSLDKDVKKPWLMTSIVSSSRCRYTTSTSGKILQACLYFTSWRAFSISQVPLEISQIWGRCIVGGYWSVREVWTLSPNLRCRSAKRANVSVF